MGKRDVLITSTTNYYIRTKRGSRTIGVSVVIDPCRDSMIAFMDHLNFVYEGWIYLNHGENIVQHLLEIDRSELLQRVAHNKVVNYEKTKANLSREILKARRKGANKMAARKAYDFVKYSDRYSYRACIVNNFIESGYGRFLGEDILYSCVAYDFDEDSIFFADHVFPLLKSCLNKESIKISA